MKKIAIYGAGGTGRMIADQLIAKGIEIDSFFDEDMTKWRGKYRDISIQNPQKLLHEEYDELIVGAASGYDEIIERLKDYGVPAEKINTSFIGGEVKARKDFLYRFAEIVAQEKIGGNVAEAGVFRGEFAKEINRAFPERKLYLFDTFEGFDKRDFNFEGKTSNTYESHFNNTSIEYVLSRMKYRDRCEVIKGYFPGICDDFCFVSLDMDLYKPILEGLKFFYPKMVGGGVILIDDYFSVAYPNIRQAVADYERELNKGLLKIPMGDNNGLAIIKPL